MKLIERDCLLPARWFFVTVVPICSVLSAINASGSVQITNPRQGMVYTMPQVVRFAVEVTPTEGAVARMEFLEGNEVLGVVTNPSFVLRVTNQSLVPAGHTVVAVAVDTNGSRTVSEAVSSVTTQDPGPPNLRIVSPADREIVESGKTLQVQVTANFTDDSAQRAELHVGNILLAVMVPPE